MDRKAWPFWVRLTLLGIRRRGIALACAALCLALGVAFPLIIGAADAQPDIRAKLTPGWTALVFGVASLGATLYVMASDYLRTPQQPTA